MTAANGNRAASATRFTGATFTALAVPLALFGAKPLDFSLAGTSIRGQLDDYAIEYLGAAAVVSLGLGISRLGKGEGMAQTSSVSSSMPAQHSHSMPSPSVPLLTEEALRGSGLHVFLEDDDAPLVAQEQSVSERASSQAVHLNAPHQQLSNTKDAPAGSVRQQPDMAGPQNAVAVPLPGSPSQKPMLNQLGQSQVQATSSTDSTTDSLASVVAEVQSIVEQLSLHAQHAGGEPVITPQPAPSLPPVQVATLPLGEGSTVRHQKSVYQQNSYPAKGYATHGYQVSGHKVNSSLDTPTMPAAQAYVSFARPQVTIEPSSTQRFSAELAALEQVYQVREQMQQLMGQLDLIQASLEQTVYPAQRLVPLRVAQAAPSYTVSAVEPVRAAVA